MRGGTWLLLLLCCGPWIAACESYPTVSRGDAGVGEGGDDGTGQGQGTGGAQLVTEGGAPGTGGSDVTAVCGNGELEPGELCDDGGTRDGDGCSADCSEQDLDFVCEPGEDCVRYVVCGSGALEGDEVCDDANERSGDGCADDCTAVEPGWLCPRPGVPCVELPVCGNAVRERGEGCDDGNDVSGDGCSGVDDPDLESCQLEPSYACRAAGEPCVRLACGDGVRTPDEDCDDGNDHAGDGCSDRCTVEVGWRCTSSGCRPVCGDGAVVADEECDDGNRLGGDGCSSACRVEPFFDCDGEPSDCASTVVCGDSMVQPGEICDPPGEEGCLAGCQRFAPDVGTPPQCGNQLIEAGETCDPPQEGAGCSLTCEAEPGFVCPRPGTCLPLPICGDGIVQLGEQCDVGDTTSLGCVDCTIQDGWDCYGVAPSVCEYAVCGDGARSPMEECDDGAGDDGDGCSAECTVEEGYTCPDPGDPCRPVCGDGVRLGVEECDDGDADNGDGCNAACRVERGYSCPVAGEDCVLAVCGNGAPEPGEGCDDGNQIAGDGCSPNCQREPTVTVGPSPVVNVFCGDGMVTGSEECDDGNADDGDGCSSLCAVEDGFTCQQVVVRPESVSFEVTYRDFIQRPEPGGHPHMREEGVAPPEAVTDRGIPGALCTTTNPTTCGRLDDEGKPQLVAGMTAANLQTAHPTLWDHPDAFSLWYRSSNPSAISAGSGVIELAPVTDQLTLDQQGGAGSETYSFDSAEFFPLDGRGFGNTADQDHDFHFTTELRYFFQYQGGETLTFRGDDDVFVFINGRLAVDIGGIHLPQEGRVILGDDGIPSGQDSDCTEATADNDTVDACSLSAAEAADANDDRFGLQRGGVYEIVLFHAERQPVQSNFHLTLTGFLAPRSFCEPDCGDGQVVGWEVCDDGAAENTGEYGQCNSTCTGRTFCGDGVLQGPTSDPVGPEVCDNGRNVNTYQTGGANPCAPGCVAPPSCGDGIVQTAYEECDAGDANDDATYGPNACRTNCTFGAYCGDGVVDEADGEVCDRGALNGQEYGPSSCDYDCLPGARCGDGIRNGAEECDGTSNCTASCTLIAFCGDGLAALSAGEACDYGQFASDAYGGCTDQCEWGPHCGDGDVDAPYEECDRGALNDDTAYDGCTEACVFGPRCGDAVVQTASDEACDNGFNDDDYAFSDDACGPGCQLPPSCGDGIVQEEFELCDEGEDNSDTAYEGCTTRCEWGPYCGDGDIDAAGGEACDDGAANVPYATDGAACGPDCQPAPYCGDGERNGSEQCDDGADRNDGEYGGCREDCILAPRCGDRVTQRDEGEECDDGPAGSLVCSPSCELRDEIR